MGLPSLADLEKKLGYVFQNKSLLKAACSHPSFSFRERPSPFERLEFLGDRVLSLVLSHKLYLLFPDKEEGVLSYSLSSLVRKETIAQIMKEHGLDTFLKTSLEKQASVPLSVIADAGEAILGAVFLDGGYQEAETLILYLWEPYLNTSTSGILKDAKSRLQEKAQSLGLPLPTYQVIKKTGPAHTPLLEVEVQLVTPSTTLTAIADGPSRKEAEQKAAFSLLEQLDVLLKETTYKRSKS